MHLILFCDTNLFLQCQPLEHLAWEEVANGATAITVYIPRTVQNEIDRLKQDGNGRRARRSRDASSKMKEMVRAAASSITFQRGDLKIHVGMASRRSKSAPRSDELDLDHSDDRIVDEALAWAHANASEAISILTNDGGMMSTAKHFGVAFTEIPSSWLLQPETDERDKKLAALERELKILREQHPRIEVSFSFGENSIERISATVTEYRDLTKAEIDAFMEEIRSYRPMARNFGGDEPCRPMNFMGAAFQKWQPPSDEAIREYTEKVCPGWEKRIQEALTNAASYSEFPSRRTVATVHIGNLGSKPAQNMHVLVTAFSGLMILPRGWSDPSWAFSPPPEPPKGKWIGPYDDLLAFGKGSSGPSLRELLYPPKMPAPRDPHKLYRNKSPDEIYDRCELSCKEFMHQVEDASFDLEIFVPRKARVTSAAIKVLVSASNLPSPFHITLPVEVTYEDGDITELVRAMIATL